MIKARRKSSKKGNIKYNNCDIPAKIFFNHLIHGEINVLGEGNPQELHKVYFDIIDEYCELYDDKLLLKLFTTQESLSRMQNTQAHIQAQIYNLKFLCSSKHDIDLVKSVIDEIKKPKIEIKVSKGIDWNVKLLEKVIGSLNNNINMLLSSERKEKKQVKTDFTKRLVLVENALGREINENVTLRKFIFLEKSAIDRAKP